MGKRATRKRVQHNASFLDEIQDAGVQDNQPVRKSFHRGEKQGQPQCADPIKDPSAPKRIADFRVRVLGRFGVSVGANAYTVLSYNPRIVQAGANFLVVICFLPRVLTASLYYQWLGLIAISEAYVHLLSDGGPKDANWIDREERWRGLTTFVLGLFVSMLLAKTYYANRGCFGTVFGCTMGFAQMTTAWVRAPVGGQRPDLAQQSARNARQQLVRWANAAFRLMVLECRPLSPEQIGEQLVDRELLTAAEWARIAGRKSRATHVYQWMNNVLIDLLEAGYIHGEVMVVKMQAHIDDMRGANVWGLPSLPIMYTLIITAMVKFYLVMVALSAGAYASDAIPFWDAPGKHVTVFIYLFFVNYLFQGLLDLHGVLYSPNQGLAVSHMPADNFLLFVETVTTDLVNDNEHLPYKMSIYVDDNNTGGPKQSGLSHDLGNDYLLIGRKNIVAGSVLSDAETAYFSM